MVCCRIGVQVILPRRHLFLPLGPSVLKPSLDLYLGESERLGQLQPLGHRQVFISLQCNVANSGSLCKTKLQKNAINTEIFFRSKSQMSIRQQCIGLVVACSHYNVSIKTDKTKRLDDLL